MLVSEILRIKGNTLFTTAPEGSVLEAVRVMAQHDIGSLVVMERGRMAGMLTFAEVLEGARGAQRQRSATSRVATSTSATRSPPTRTSTSWSCAAACSSATRATSR